MFAKDRSHSSQCHESRQRGVLSELFHPFIRLSIGVDMGLLYVRCPLSLSMSL